MRIATCLIVAVLTAFAQAPATPGPVPQAVQSPRLTPVVQSCVPCHGARGEGKPVAGFPRIAAQSESYIRKQLDNYADGSRRDPVMEPIAKGLPPELRAEVAAYFAQADAPLVSGASPFTRSWVERGRLIATQGDPVHRVQACINCHGPGGRGQPPALPYLAGLDDRYIRSTLEAWRDGRRRNDAGEQMGPIAKALTPDDIAAVARYYAGLTPPPPQLVDLVQPPRPQFLAAGTTPSVTEGSTTPPGTGTGIESGAPRTGGTHGLASGGASAGKPGAEAPGTSSEGTPRPHVPAAAWAPTAEGAARGLSLIAGGAHGCAACHTIPGIRTPRGIVGPDLTAFAGRPFVAGQLPNRPDVLVAFLQNSPALVPNTGMPNLRLSLEDARSIAAYLYTLGPKSGR